MALQRKAVRWWSLVFDHGYHLFSLGYYLGGPVEKVFAWIDQTPIREAGGMVKIDAPAMHHFPI